MKNLFLIFSFFAFIFVSNINAQIYDPVKWSSSSKQISDDEFELTWTAKIESGWYIYSQYIGPDDGPSATVVAFDNPKAIKLIGKNIEGGHLKKKFDEIWGVEISKFSELATFKQKIKVLDDTKPIKGYVNFQTCDNSKCLPPTDYEFTFSLKNKKSTGLVDPNTTKDEKVAGTDSKSGDPAELAIKTPETQVENSGIMQPVNWTASISKDGSGNPVIRLIASIDKGWHIYSLNNKEDGPIPMSFMLDKDTKGEIDKNIIENAKDKTKAFDKFFNVNVTTIDNSAEYILTLKNTEEGKMIFGTADYMSCNEKTCVPLNAYFRISADRNTIEIMNSEFSDEDKKPVVSGADAGIFPINNIQLDKPLSNCTTSAESEVAKSSLLNIILLGFIGGLIALLTPCVFPMIPLTVSFFTKGSKDKKKGLTNAFLYGFFIFAIYLLLSLPFHLLDSINPNILNDISTNVWLNVAFFIIFMFFAFSFFGYYDISLPSSFSNKVASAEGIGGFLGIFFMALTLALVSFSCTGPILGSLLAGALSSDGGAWQLTAGMGGFGLALALPFALFAAFPGWMNSMPKSGGWLTTVKVVLGFLELALAFKFLSNADLVKHWGLLKIEPFLIIWILVALGMAAYLFGLIRFPHDTKLKKLSPVRGGLAVVSLIFAIYLMSGFRYNEDTKTFTSLSLLSGLAPPVGYSFIHPKDCPQNLNCFHDLDEGLAYAKARNMPVFLDFTGYACVNCRKMEEHVWVKEEVYSILSKEYVVISLYVDDKTELPENEQVTLTFKTGGQKKIRTKGDKWAFFQTDNFNNNSQPWYALLTNTGTLLNTPVGYTPEVKDYVNFLQCGLDAYKAAEGKELIGKVEK
ncbi:MAG: thioredoxin family protein [Saprospiraceae bacterium]|nr:thioredoxin family protein [Candidatus Brachybacter algidus]